jgi:hypothetical protein
MASPLRSPTGQEVASFFAEHSENKARITTQQVYAVHPTMLPFSQITKRRKGRVIEEYSFRKFMEGSGSGLIGV